MCIVYKCAIIQGVAAWAVRATRLQIERLHSFHSRFGLFDEIEDEDDADMTRKMIDLKDNKWFIL